MASDGDKFLIVDEWVSQISFTTDWFNFLDFTFYTAFDMRFLILKEMV